MEKSAANCGISRTLEVIGGKWTLLIVYALLEKERRFGELEQTLPGISPRTLTTRLKELEQEQVLERDCQGGSSHPLYRLTAKGRSLSQILGQMDSWGAEGN